MLRKEYKYFIAAITIGTLLSLMVIKSKKSAISKRMVEYMVNEIHSAKDAADDKVVEEEPPIFNDFAGTSQEDPKFIQFVKDYAVQPPSTRDYRLENPDTKDFSQYKQATIANEVIFKGKKNGFFVEAGAFDGEEFSNTLFFEREFGWNGLLIEPNFDTFEKISEKGRKAYSVHGALSPVKSAMDFIIHHVGSKGFSSAKSPDSVGIHVSGYPFYSILAAIGVQEIDFLSLDIEGMELQVLRTIPWDKVKIRVLCIDKMKISLTNLQEYMTSLGYKHIGVNTEDAWFVDAATWKEGMDISVSALKGKI